MARNIDWAAGLFDGEGTFGIHKRNALLKDGRSSVWLFRMQLTMTDEDSVRSFHDVVGIGGIEYRYLESHKETGRKPTWRWTATGKKAEELAWKILRDLSKRRQARFAELMSEIFEHNQNR